METIYFSPIPRIQDGKRFETVCPYKVHITQVNSRCCNGCQYFAGELKECNAIQCAYTEKVGTLKYGLTTEKLSSSEVYVKDQFKLQIQSSPMPTRKISHKRRYKLNY